MPTSYRSPGVYFEAKLPLSRPIRGVGTSTAGFIGVVAATVTMPDKPDGSGTTYTLADEGKEILVTSWNEFITNFGEPQAGNSYLAHAVFGFFDNGGTRCYLIRASSGDLANITGELEIFAGIDEIAIVAVPGGSHAQGVHRALLEHCQQTGDRVAILDGVQRPASITASAITDGLGQSETGSHGAIYFPWIEVYAAYADDNKKFVPPSGHIAGIYARNDATRGVFKSPANEIVLGASALEYRISKNQQDELNPKGVNAIREFNGAFKVWGARTLAAEGSEYQYINIRRYMNYLRESIDEATQWVPHEPNTPSLWKSIERTVTGFLTNEWRAGALFGETERQAFYVKCDEDINPPDVRQLGQVIIEIGVQPVEPAEFVIFRVQKTRS